MSTSSTPRSESELEGSGTAASRDWLRAGRVARPHGLDGSFHVVEAVGTLLAVGVEVSLGDGLPPRRIERRAGHDARVIVRLEGCADRASAEALRGRILLVPRAIAPKLGDDEWWADELEGCEVHDGARPVGVVARLLALPSCEVLEVTRDGADDLLVPLVGDAVRTVDTVLRRVDIDLAFLGED